MPAADAVLVLDNGIGVVVRRGVDDQLGSGAGDVAKEGVVWEVLPAPKFPGRLPTPVPLTVETRCD